MISEGKVSIETEDAFYNPRMGLDRDMTVAALRAWREWSKNYTDEKVIYADVTAATGIRGIRMALEANYDVYINDRSKKAIDRVKENVKENGIEEKANISQKDANIFLRTQNFEIVDVDPFGSPIPFCDSAFNSAWSLVCFTATDVAPLCGAHSSGKRRYSCIPLNTEYHPEMGLRVLIGSLVRTAARYDVSIQPLLSYSYKHYKRSILAVDSGAKKANQSIKGLGYISHCFNCLYRSYSYGIIFKDEVECPNCENELQIAGPLWLDKIVDSEFIKKTKRNLSSYMENCVEAKKILSLLEDELENPTHYDHHRLCKLWSLQPDKLESLIKDIRNSGFRASKTHYSGTSFKTDAKVNELKNFISR